MKKTEPGISGIHDAENLNGVTALRPHKSQILPRFLKEEAFRIANQVDEERAKEAKSENRNQKKT